MAPPEERDLWGFSVALISVLEDIGVPYAIGGSVAAMEYGEPRLTLDIDVMVGPSNEQLEAFVRAVEELDLYVTPLASILADEGRKSSNTGTRASFNVIDGGSGAKADLYWASDSGLSASAMGRRVRRTFDSTTDTSAWFLSPEDVILFKLDHYRRGGEVAQKHPIDIAKVVAVTGPTLDVDYIETWAEQLDVSDLWDALSP